MDIKPKISIIVPCYNAQDYISKCVDSIINQTYKYIEIILIDDGSSDNTKRIIENYATKDKRIIVISKDNGGISETRNLGIQKAEGKYLMFIDNDDWIDHNTCELALLEIEKNDADVLMWSYIREYTGKSIKKIIYKEDKIIFDKSDVLNKLYRHQIGLYKEELSQPENTDALSPVWTKLYKASLIKDNNISFYNSTIIGPSEDGLFNLEIFNHAKKVVYISKYFYHYLKINSGSYTKNYKANLHSQWNEVFKLIETNIQKNNLSDDFYEAFNNKKCLSIIGLGLNVCQSDKNNFKKIKELKSIISSSDYRLAYKKLSLKYFPLHWKLFFLSAKMNFATGLYVQLLVIKKIIGRK